MLLIGWRRSGKIITTKNINVTFRTISYNMPYCQLGVEERFESEGGLLMKSIAVSVNWHTVLPFESAIGPTTGAATGSVIMNSLRQGGLGSSKD